MIMVIYDNPKLNTSWKKSVYPIFLLYFYIFLKNYMFVKTHDLSKSSNP